MNRAPAVCAQPARKAPSQPKVTTTPTVLVIEDDADVHDGWVMYLRHHGYEVSSANDGAEGVQAIRQACPDLVLLDLGLPGLHGLDVIREVRSAGIRVPIVVVTASASMQVDVEARELGADVVLSKPIESSLLLPVFDELLDRRSSA